MKHLANDYLDKVIIKESNLVSPISVLKNSSYMLDEKTRICGVGESSLSGIFSPPSFEITKVKLYGQTREKLEALFRLFEQMDGMFQAICVWNACRHTDNEFGIERVIIKDGKTTWEDVTP